MENWGKPQLWVLGCHLEHKASLLFHPCLGIFAEGHIWASQSANFIERM